MFSLRLIQESLQRYAKIAKHESIFIEEMEILKDNVQHPSVTTEGHKMMLKKIAGYLLFH